MARRPHHTLSVDTDPGVDVTLVARILTDAAALVRTRTERGAPPRSDQRPRILDAIDRATRNTQQPGTTTEQARDWAIVHAAMGINAALGRGRYRDGLDVTAACATLAGFGLDVGTLGAVNTAADLLHQAADTARRVARAVDVQVARHGPVRAYPLASASLEHLEPDDILTVAASAPGAAPTGLRILQIVANGGNDGSPRLVVDTSDGPQPWPTETQSGRRLPVTAWRPVPYPRPWRPGPDAGPDVSAADSPAADPRS